MTEKSAIFGEILPRIDYPERPSVYGVVKNDSNQVLLIRSPGGIFLPGGGIDPGETHAECLKREFLEETGYAVIPEQYLGMGTLYGIAPKTETYLKIIGYFYVASLGPFIAPKTEKKNEMFWLDIREAKSALKLPNQRWALQEYIQQWMSSC